MKTFHQYCEQFDDFDTQVQSDENIPPEYEEPHEPEEDDIATKDHQTWYQHGKLYHKGDEASLKQKMAQDQFWPNVWFISDHGNAHLMTL